MRKLRDLSTTPIELLGWFGLHLGAERLNRRRVFFPNDPTWRILWTTSALEWTGTTVAVGCPIGVFDTTFTLFGASNACSLTVCSSVGDEPIDRLVQVGAVSLLLTTGAPVEPGLDRKLLGLGLRQFSMHPAHLLEVKQVVLKSDLQETLVLTQKMLRADEPERLGTLLLRMNR